jgi:lactoylglutathione lyase
MKIATVAVYVEDQKAALSFWKEKVGLMVRRSHPVGLDVSWIELGERGAESCLVLYPKSLMPDWPERKPSVVFECEDIQEKYRQLAERGVPFTQPPKDLPWGQFAVFSDTEGNLFGLRQKLAGSIPYSAPKPELP